MSELTDLNATGNGLAAVSGGLQGLLEAYKMKMAQSVEQAKVNQQGLDAGAQARMMMPFHQAQLDAAANALKEKTLNDAAQNRIKAFSAGLPDPGGDGGPTPMSFMARDYLSGQSNPANIPKSGPQAMMFAREVNQQTNGAGADAAKLQSAWNQKMASSNPATPAQQRAAMSLVDNLETMKQMVPMLGLGDVAGPDAIMKSGLANAAANLPGTMARKYLSLAGPGQSGKAREDTGRFSMGEMQVFDKATSLNNIKPDLIGNLTGQQNDALERVGMTGKYVPKVIPGYLPDAPAAPAASGSSASPAPNAPSSNWQDYAQ